MSLFEILDGVEVVSTEVGQVLHDCCSSPFSIMNISLLGLDILEITVRTTNLSHDKEEVIRYNLPRFKEALHTFHIKDIIVYVRKIKQGTLTEYLDLL
ncbi:MAG: hypothetical protein Sylvanvirus3_18 [Sylvanvirus sp.]|uniref:Uncharacterized protein n=1 Tax=Sylvanvirus sp. TaxID=2487774 RepID=A0A3G5AIZ0_9VIRU|nr:MAG: hypothetical protein Sylvanvirus3_18 [Sylvanvirus sp.]